MALEAGSVFLVDRDELPGATAQLISQSPTNGGWLVACTFPGEEAPGVIASVLAEAWFELGRWHVSAVEEVPAIPLPFAVVMQGCVDVLVDFNGDAIRGAREGELEMLGRPRAASPVRLLKACRAYAGVVESTPDLEDMTAASYLFRLALIEDAGLSEG